MRSKYYIPIFILAIVITSIYFYKFVGINMEQNERTYPSSFNSDIIFHPINEIKQNNFILEIYNTEGFVVAVYTCPPCPKYAQCEPCMRNNIVISMDNEIVKSYSLTANELILFAENPKQFELGKKYKFAIKKSGYRPNEFELVGYDLIK